MTELLPRVFHPGGGIAGGDAVQGEAAAWCAAVGEDRDGSGRGGGGVMVSLSVMLRSVADWSPRWNTKAGCLPVSVGPCHCRFPAGFI